jgi:hypothetical protein
MLPLEGGCMSDTESDETLPPHLRAAIIRLAERERPPPAYLPRVLRLVDDYTLRVAWDSLDPDDFAEKYLYLGSLQKLDPPGDPPATVTAQETSRAAGRDNAKAYQLLETIRDTSHDLMAHARDVRACHPPQWRCCRLQREAGASRLSGWRPCCAKRSDWPTG